MSARTDQLRKINCHLRLTAENLGQRAILTALDALETMDVSTTEKFNSALAGYHKLATHLGSSKSFHERAALLADIIRLETPQRSRCYEDLAAEARARKTQDELDDLDNDPEDEYGEEDRSECRCIQRQWAAMTTRAVTVSRCDACRAGNHSACDYECGADDTDEWLAAHPDAEDAELRRRLDVIGKQIRRETDTREFLDAVRRGNGFDFIEE